ncbi:MAG: hypothetical protein ACP5N7_03040 [Candidatus Pacearchaeota archaeon]
MPDMQKVLETKNRIIKVIQERGPDFPVRVASIIGQNNIFTAAFMSELVGEQKLKLSSMRVGGSPLYFIPGQEEQLQRFTEYLNHKEKEAFKLLKQNEILEDSQQEPAIRVALRSIKDFAIPVKIIDNGQEKTFWKIHTLSNDKTKELIEKIISPKKQEVKEIEKKVEKDQTKELLNEIQLEKTIQEKTTVKEKLKKETSSTFSDNVKKILSEREYEVIKEILSKKKEFSAKIKLNTNLGTQELYLTVKDKKKITLEDLVSTLQKAQSEKMPALILSPGEIDKKALEYYKEWSNLIKHQKINF